MILTCLSTILRLTSILWNFLQFRYIYRRVFKNVALVNGSRILTKCNICQVMKCQVSIDIMHSKTGQASKLSRGKVRQGKVIKKKYKCMYCSIQVQGSLVSYHVYWNKVCGCKSCVKWHIQGYTVARETYLLLPTMYVCISAPPVYSVVSSKTTLKKNTHNRTYKICSVFFHIYYTYKTVNFRWFFFIIILRTRWAKL